MSTLPENKYSRGDFADMSFRLIRRKTIAMGAQANYFDIYCSWVCRRPVVLGYSNCRYRYVYLLMCRSFVRSLIKRWSYIVKTFTFPFLTDFSSRK